jgi:hypothetical protein
MTICDAEEPSRGWSNSYASRVQQVSAVLNTRELLLRLVDTKRTPRVPREIRAEARALLRSFPASHVLRPVLEGESSLVNPRRPLLPVFH